MADRTISLWVCFVLLSLVPEAGAAEFVPDRGSLNAILGPSAVTEDFEGFSFSGPYQGLGGSGTIVDSSSWPVVEGIAFSSIGGGMRIEDLGYLGRSQVLSVTGSGPRSLIIDFRQPVTAFGFNFLPTVLSGTDVTLTLFAADDQSIVDIKTVRVFFSAQFIGVSDSTEFGRVEISSLATSPFNIYGARIDNLTFGAVEPIVHVSIDIKPGSSPNSINPYNRGLIPVAVIGSSGVDVTDIDVTTLSFGPDGAGVAHDLSDSFDYNLHLQDVNLDGHIDLMLHFRTRETGVVCGDTEGTLTGSFLGGTSLEGADTFRTVGCNSNRRSLWDTLDKQRGRKRGHAVGAEPE